jgi:hypothetical protein
MAPKPVVHGVIGVQGGSGATLIASLLALRVAEAGERVLLVPRQGDLDSMNLYLGLSEGAIDPGEPPPPAGPLTARLGPTRLDRLWLLGEGPDPGAEDLRAFQGDRVVIDSPPIDWCDHLEWVGRPDPAGIARLREQVLEGVPSKACRVWLNGERDRVDRNARDQLEAYWTRARGIEGIHVAGLPWHEGAWQASRNRQDLRAVGWGPLRQAVWTATDEARA